MTILVAFLTGLDNFLVASGLGPLKLEKDRKIKLAILFGLCEFFMPVLGFYLASSLEVEEWIAPLALFLCGILILASWKFSGLFQKMTAPAIWSLPLILSFDNLMAGVGFAAMDTKTVLHVVTIGFISALLSFAGMFIGEAVSNKVKINHQLLSGTYLTLLSVFVFITEGL